MRSKPEWAASLRIPRLPVAIPTVSLKTVRKMAAITELDAAQSFSLAETVRIVNELEENITKEFPQIFRVVIHQEPVSHNSK